MQVVLMLIGEIVLLGALFAAAWMDYRKKELPLVFILSIVAAGFVFQVIVQRLGIWDILLGGLIGALFLGIGKITKQSFGYGDGLMLIATGIFLGFERNVFLIMLGLFVAAVFSIGLLIFRKKGKKDEIPFMPFLFGGYVLLLAF